jgi:hypothetical protein
MVVTSQIDDLCSIEPLLGLDFEIRLERERVGASHGGSVMEVVSSSEELRSSSHGDSHGSLCQRERELEERE